MDADGDMQMIGADDHKDFDGLAGEQVEEVGYMLKSPINQSIGVVRSLFDFVLAYMFLRFGGKCMKCFFMYCRKRKNMKRRSNTFLHLV